MKLLSLILRALIRTYQLTISPYLAPSCRYYPSCSSYGLEAVERHGPFYGAWLTLRRLLRCHPWGGEGYDPVPERSGRAREAQDRHPRPASNMISRELPE